VQRNAKEVMAEVLGKLTAKLDAPSVHERTRKSQGKHGSAQSRSS
jgi:hypothetical protein